MCIREFYDRKQPSAFTTVHLTAASLGAYAPQPSAVPGADPQEAEEGSPNTARPPGALLTRTAVSTPAEASRLILPSAPRWKSKLYTGSLLCQAISHVITFMAP